MNHARNGRGPWMRVLVLAAAVVVAPLPAMAGDVEPSATRPVGLVAAGERAIATATPKQPQFAQAQGESSRTDLGSGSFFKTKAGIITLVAVGVGLGMALYSTSNDRVKSPNVKYGNGGR